MWTEQKKAQWAEKKRQLMERVRTARGTVQFQLTAVYCAIVLLLLLILNIYPVISTRNVVFRDKERSMTASASVISSALTGLDTLTGENVAPVLEILDVAGLDHVLITDERKNVVYDTWGEMMGSNVSGVYPELEQAFHGKMVFRSDYTEESFSSRAAAPVMVSGRVIGSVYLTEDDAEQSEMIRGIQHRLALMSAVLALLGLGVSVVFAAALTRRIKELAQAVRVVQAGDYTHHIQTRGSDEITELGEEFNSMTDILRQTEQSRRQFVSDASHELKTPLASIRLLTDSILQSENIDRETILDFVGDIGQSAARLQSMTEKLLDLSRLDSGAVAESVPVDMAALTREILRMLRPLAEEKQVELICAAESPVYVMATEDDLYQILFNLGENAVKYNVPGGTVTMTVTGDGPAVLTVSDTGIGIPEKDLPNIFARFYRVDKTRSREAGGSGLGLSIVRDTVIMHSGTIAVSQNVPQGTVFTVTFPQVSGEELQVL